VGNGAVALAALALGAVLQVLDSDWIYSSLFHYTVSPWEVAFTLALAAALLVTLALGVAKAVGTTTVTRALDFASLAVAAFVTYQITKQKVGFGGGLPLAAKGAIVVVVVAVAALAALRLPAHALARLRVALVFGSICFVLSPELLFPLEQTRQITLQAPFTADAPTPDANVVFVVLDELGQFEDSPVLAALRSGGRTVRARGVVPAGHDTIDAIPGLLTGRDLGEARPCTSSGLCDDEGLFDFARQTVRRSRTNVVGFYHPYCDIAGLAYCREIPVFGPDHVVLDYACGLLGSFARGDARKSEFCERRWLDSDRAEAGRHALESAVDGAPFWRDGGFLFVHVPLPHPPGSRPGATLDADYAENLVAAGRFVDGLASRLESRFGDAYTLVVTADHPLRIATWCRMHRYASATCTASRYRSSEVPLIVVGRHADELMAVAKDVDLLPAIARAVDGTHATVASP
jgi:hypothetical protein